MKITNEGLKSLSVSREPIFDENVNSYLIYEWKDLQYFASMIKPPNLSENQVFIEVSEEQFLAISKEDTYASKITNADDISKVSSEPLQQKPSKATPEGTSNLSILSQITAKYKSALLLRYNQDENSLILDDLVGEINPKEGFKISLKHPSPFRIALQTLKPFHGNYSENEIVNQNLIQCGINSQNLWITAFPIHENKQLIGMLIGLSNDQVHKVEDLEVFKSVEFFAKQILSSNKATAA